MRYIWKTSCQQLCFSAKQRFQAHWQCSKSIPDKVKKQKAQLSTVSHWPSQSLNLTMKQCGIILTENGAKGSRYWKKSLQNIKKRAMGKHFCTVLFTCKFQYYYYLLTLGTSEKYLESETNTIGDFPFNILHMSTLPGTVHLKKKKKRRNHAPPHWTPENSHPGRKQASLTVDYCHDVSAVCTVCTEASRWQRSFYTLHFPHQPSYWRTVKTFLK